MLCLAVELFTKLPQLDPNAMAWLMKQKTMMVGIDVTHPGPTSRLGTPSIAAVVASTDNNFVQFPCSIRIQESRKEVCGARSYSLHDSDVLSS
jgi:eukaryotic translation initiation factor 2C